MRRGASHLIWIVAFAAIVGCSAGGGAGASAGTARPDLVVLEVEGTPRNAIPSGTVAAFAITVTIENPGSRKAGTPFRVGLYLSSDAVIEPGSDILVQDEVVLELEGRETRQIHLDGSFPPAFPGLYWVGAYIDDDPAPGNPGSLVEEDEGNNFAIDLVQLEVYPSPPPPPTMLIGEDTMDHVAGAWYVEGAIILKWDAVPRARSYNVYRWDPSLMDWERRNPSPIPGPSLGPEFNFQAFIDGTSLAYPWATPIPTNGEGRIAGGTYEYKVESVDVVGLESSSGPTVTARHADLGPPIPTNVITGSPGGNIFQPESISTLVPTFDWISSYAPDQWSFTIFEAGGGVDPTWMYFGFEPGQVSVSLPFGDTGAFTMKEPDPLRSNTTYLWVVKGHDPTGWAIIFSQIYAIRTP